MVWRSRSLQTWRARITDSCRCNGGLAGHPSVSALQQSRGLSSLVDRVDAANVDRMQTVG